MENEVLEEATCTINDLPNEIVSLILMYTDCLDTLNFGATCKRFNEMVKFDQILWKVQFKCTRLKHDVINVVESQCNGNWYGEIKKYFGLKKQIYHEVSIMSSQYYWRQTDISLEDVRNFFAIALSHELCYYYAVHTLQEISMKGKRILERWHSDKPFSLTEIYYAKVALRHLMHTFLALKWIKMHTMEDTPGPLFVLNFFLQWVDTEHLYFDENIDFQINELAKRVEETINLNFPSKTKDTIKERIAKGQILENQVLNMITQTIYMQPHMTVTSTANIDTLNVVKVLEYKCGNSIAVGAIYSAVAKKFNVNCELVAFPNHLFLEWRDMADCNPRPKVYTVEIGTGELHPKRSCPFAQGTPSDTYKYYPDALLQYIYSAFHMTMGAIRNWHTQNALLLLDFLGPDGNEFNPYKNFLEFLINRKFEPIKEHLYKPDIKSLEALAYLNPPLSTTSRTPTVKRHASGVKFAVGMICYHKKLEYVCIVRGWEVTCPTEWQRRMEFDSLEFGFTQPFYHVTAADQTERYVAQENLALVIRPTRLHHLEDFIAREFALFDGFSYIPNTEKRSEYPDDPTIVEKYKSRAPQMPNVLNR